MAAPSSQGRLLLVDDHAADRRYLREILKELPVELMEAANGAEALEMAAELVPDLVLLDARLPGEDGFAVCQRLQDDPDIPPIPVIMLSARAELEDRLRGLRAGATEFLAKPVDAVELSLRVQNLLTQRREQGKLEAALRKAKKEAHARAEWSAYAVDQLEERLAQLEVCGPVQRRRLRDASRLAQSMGRPPGWDEEGAFSGVPTEWCDLSVMAEELEADLEGTLEYEDLGGVEADRDLLRRLLSQLLGVASELSEARGAPAAVRLSVRSAQSGRRSMEIAASGTGIWHQAFERLAKGSIVSTSIPHGHPWELAFAFCRHAVDLMEGAVEVEALPGKGWVFVVTLPSESSRPPSNVVAFSEAVELALDNAVSR